MSSIHVRPPSRAAILALAVLLLGAPPALRGQNPHGGEQPDAVDAPIPVEEGVDYRVYDRWGNRTSLQALVGSSVGDDVLLVGEEHGDPVGHAVEALLLETVVREIGTPRDSGRPVVLSMEMFERDVQYIVDEYLAGLISEDHFLRSARPWDDYDARYRPLVEMAKERGIPVVAANAPRRYVNRVTTDGPESLIALSREALAYLPPLPYPGPSTLYREQWDAIMESAMEAAEAAEGEESIEAAEGEEAAERTYTVSPNAIYAQALWDASMGHAVTQALVRHLDAFVVHVAGSFHVARGTGIPERIDDYRPGTEVTSVVMTAVDDIDAWSEEDHAPLGDFVVLTRSAR